MKHLAVVVLRAVALGTGVATMVLGLMQRIAMAEAILLLALGQSCLAIASLRFAGSGGRRGD